MDAMVPKSKGPGPKRKFGKIMLLIALVLPVLLCLGACAGGPSDFLTMAAPPQGDHRPPIRSMAERQELASSLEAEKRTGTTATSAGPSIGELEALRRQQDRQVRQLQAEVATDPNVAAANRCGEGAAIGSCP
ncbi:hypothetical protein [Pleomorphomonas carboxyditropha]|uniref:Uncharacterized protein n=1 Tax=Pleomorphomonas carboxyditropha TaxID=2023338 RepID=A0A2G9WRM0_9HYPH|nr:hypothetical protein [Pleomorphomonas carboxyditropha]PIO97314.1 hypothetical protein CJ014_21125 [Pleomorphomonas carboxyditropha]